MTRVLDLLPTWLNFFESIDFVIKKSSFVYFLYLQREQFYVNIMSKSYNINNIKIINII